MARRNDHTREELKAMALTAGLNMIEEGSLTNMTLRKVAEAIKYTPGTIQNLFGSYAVLVLSINQITLSRLQAYLQQRVALASPEPDKEPATALIALTNAYIDFAINNLNAWRALFEFNSPDDVDISKEHAALIQEMLAYVSRLFLPLCENNPETALQHTKIIWASVHGICQLGLSHKLDLIGVNSTHELAQLFLANYLRGLN